MEIDNGHHTSRGIDDSHPEAAIRALLARLPLPRVFEAMQDGVFILDHQGRVIFLNAEARRLLGTDDPQLLQRPMDEQFAQDHAHDPPNHPIELKRWYTTRLMQGETITAENPMVFSLIDADDVEHYLSLTGAPLLEADGKLLGVIGVVRDLTNQRHTDALHAELAAREQEAHAASERAARELERLQMALDTALMRLSLDDLLHELLKRAIAALDTDTATFSLVDEQGTMLETLASIGLEEEVEQRVRVPIGQGFSGHIAQTRKPYHIADTHKGEVASALLRNKVRSAVGAPLLVEDRLLGVLYVGTRRPRSFSPGDIWLLQQFADRAAQGIARARLYEDAQRAHRQSADLARQLEAIIEALSEGVVMIGPNGETIRSNSAYHRMLGIDKANEPMTTAERGQVTKPRDITGAEIPQPLWPGERVRRGEVLDGAHGQDVWLRSTDGHDALYNATGGPVTDEHGQVIGAVLALRDVTEFRRLEMEAKARAVELEAIIETMVDGLFLHAPDGSILRANTNGRLLMGLPLDAQTPISPSVVSRHVAFISEHGEPLSSDKWPVSQVLLGAALTGSHAVRVRARLADDSERVFTVTGAPMRAADGALLGAVMVMRDVTERQMLELRTQIALESMLEMAEAAVVVSDARGQTLSINQVARRFAELTCRVMGCKRIGITVRDSATGVLRILAVSGLSPEQEAHWWGKQDAAERAGVRIEDFPFPEITERVYAGEPIVLNMDEPRFRDLPNPYDITSMLLAPMHVGQRLIGFITLDYDTQPHTFTTEELQLASAISKLCALVIERDTMLRKQADATAQVIALEQANQRMDEFLGIAAHELRTPITVIKANLQMLQRRAARSAVTNQGASAGTQSQRETDLLDRTEKSLLRLTRLVDDLLDVSRVRAGKLEMRIEPVNIANILSDTVEEQRLATPERTIKIDLPADTSALVLADPERVSQVITNYLTNALKYSNATEPVHTRLRVLDDVALVSVTDHGPGIAPEDHELVWELFHRIPGVDVVSGSGIGLGLGLHLCKTLIERQDGQVGLSSQPGKGSTFWFTLPLRPATNE